MSQGGQPEPHGGSFDHPLFVSPTSEDGDRQHSVPQQWSHFWLWVLAFSRSLQIVIDWTVLNCGHSIWIQEKIITREPVCQNNATHIYKCKARWADWLLAPSPWKRRIGGLIPLYTHANSTATLKFELPQKSKNIVWLQISRQLLFYLNCWRSEGRSCFYKPHLRNNKREGQKSRGLPQTSWGGSSKWQPRNWDLKHCENC